MGSHVPRLQPMQKISSEENARLDAEAGAEFAAGVGIPLKEAFAWLHDLIDGIERPMPRAQTVTRENFNRPDAHSVRSWRDVWSGRASQGCFGDLAVMVLHQCIRPPIEAVASGHHCPSGPFTPPDSVNAEKTEPPSRLTLSQTSAGNLLKLGQCGGDHAKAPASNPRP